MGHAGQRDKSESPKPVVFSCSGFGPQGTSGDICGWHAWGDSSSIQWVAKYPITTGPTPISKE